jgi:hypothetical protein
MAIWLGKQYLGQKDKTQIGGGPNSPPMTALLLAAKRENAKEEK